MLPSVVTIICDHWGMAPPPRPPIPKYALDRQAGIPWSIAVCLDGTTELAIFSHSFNCQKNRQPLTETLSSVSWQDGCINEMTYKPSKLGQTDLVFGLWSDSSEFISRSVQVCTQNHKFYG